MKNEIKGTNNWNPSSSDEKLSRDAIVAYASFANRYLKWFFDWRGSDSFAFLLLQWKSPTESVFVWQCIVMQCVSNFLCVLLFCFRIQIKLMRKMQITRYGK